MDGKVGRKARKERREKLIWIIGTKAKDEISVRSNKNGIPLHRHFGKGCVIDIVASVVGRADDSLEDVAVEMEGMTAGVEVVEDDFDDLVFLEDEGVGVGAVDGGVGGGDAGGEGAVEGGDFGPDVGDVVEESADVEVSNGNGMGGRWWCLLVCAVA